MDGGREEGKHGGREGEIVKEGGREGPPKEREGGRESLSPFPYLLFPFRAQRSLIALKIFYNLCNMDLHLVVQGGGHGTPSPRPLLGKPERHHLRKC